MVKKKEVLICQRGIIMIGLNIKSLGCDGFSPRNGFVQAPESTEQGAGRSQHRDSPASPALPRATKERRVRSECMHSLNVVSRIKIVFLYTHRRTFAQ